MKCSVFVGHLLSHGSHVLQDSLGVGFLVLVGPQNFHFFGEFFHFLFQLFVSRVRVHNYFMQLVDAASTFNLSLAEELHLLVVFVHQVQNVFETDFGVYYVLVGLAQRLTLDVG